VPSHFSNSHLLHFLTMFKIVQNCTLVITNTVSLISTMSNSWQCMIFNQPPCPSACHCLKVLLPVNLIKTFLILCLLQSPVSIADGVDSSPTHYIFSYNGSPITVSTNSTPQCTSSSCQYTFRVSSSQAQQYTVSVAARNVVGMGNASTPVTVGM